MAKKQQACAYLAKVLLICCIHWHMRYALHVLHAKGLLHVEQQSSKQLRDAGNPGATMTHFENHEMQKHDMYQIVKQCH